jgi:FKBP-type peptidyl-prolyl cis-trans isomerase FkpA
MKKILVVLSFVLTLFAGDGCINDAVCKDRTVQSEQAEILSYAAAQGINGTAHSSGLYYQVINPGSGPTPGPNSTITIKYIGKLLNGATFDDKTTTPVPYVLSSMIQGFQVGMPLIQKGGSIKLIVPSSMGYGCNGFGAVFSNSILYFEVELTDVQ